MVTANSVKFSSVTYKIFPSNTGEPSRSMFDAQSLLFGLRSRHDCENTTISFVLLCVGTIWAVKHRTKVHFYAKTSRLPSNRSSDTYDLFWCLSSTPRNHVTWRHFWNGSILKTFFPQQYVFFYFSFGRKIRAFLRNSYQVTRSWFSSIINYIPSCQCSLNLKVYKGKYSGCALTLQTDWDISIYTLFLLPPTRGQ